MSEANEAFRRKLLAIFADEAREHLQQIDTALLALEQGAPGTRDALVEPVLKTLHTLKGAARAVDLGELERLCHALEGTLVALGATSGALRAADFDKLLKAVSLARELTGAPGGRVRNQASALCLQLDQLAAELAGSGAEAHGDAPVAPPPTAGNSPPNMHTVVAAKAGTHAELAITEPSSDPVSSAWVPAFAGSTGGAANADADATGDLAPQEVPASLAPDHTRTELVRVDAAQLDAIRAEAETLLASELSLKHQIGELRALATAVGEARGAAPGGAGFELQCERLAQRLDASCGALTATRGRLMGAILETALVPFAAALDELPALVRSLERSRGREVALEIDGDGVLVDRRVIGLVREALIHLVTNAVDHGIEPAPARLAAGKRAAGVLRVSASQRDARQLLVRVSDDGAGIDAEALARAAARLAGTDAAALGQLDGRARLALALRAGVSTREQVTEVSGRGMGLAIVADKVAAAGGELSIDSEPGLGSAFSLLLPVYVASVRALVVSAAGLRYVAPLDALDAVRALAPGDIGTVGQRETLVVDGRVLPLVRLATLFGGAAAVPDAPAVALIARGGEREFALLADAIVAEQDVLPKRLGPLLRRVRYFTGAAQLGDGCLVPVLGLDDIARHGMGPAAAPQETAAAGGTARRVLVAEDSITSRLLLKHILESAGCEVETAADGLDALSKLRQGRFDAVVSDVEMPHMDGLALTAAIRANAATADLPVILVTSLQTPAERERGLRAGADAYLTKGAFDQDQLLAALRRLA
jgi:two-component system chemotaxis sensor kinase CheA